MENISNATSGILWYDIREKYLDDRIYPSQKMSIVEDFRFRLFSQDTKYFPIKLIRSIFTNAAKIESDTHGESAGMKKIDEVIRFKDRFDSMIDFCIDRISVLVYDSVLIESAPMTVNIHKLWKYPLSIIKKLGFKPQSGEIFIELSREKDNIRQVYSCNSFSDIASKITGVQKLSQLHLIRTPGINDILSHSISDLKALRKIMSLNISISDLDAKCFKQHVILWSSIFPLLEDLLRDMTVIFSQYNISLAK